MHTTNWVVVLAAVMFAAVALAMIAPIVLHDPFATAAALMIGIFVGRQLVGVVAYEPVA